MSRFSNRDDDNFKTVTIDGKPTRILKDKGRVRISMTMRDSLSPLQRAVADSTGSRGKSQDAKPAFTDGYNLVDPAAGLKPGYRIPVVQDRRAVRDAYAADAAYQRNRYKCGDGERLCDDCGGEGYDQDGNVCDTCHGKGVMPEVEDQREPGKLLPDPASDHRSLDRHRANMQQIYDSYNRDLEQQWRTTK
jgi:hypothetical protein